jgi:putative oxidoreductase
MNATMTPSSTSSPAALAPRDGIFARLVRTDDSATQAILRITLGVVMFPHGAQKALGWFGGYGFEGTMGFLTQQVGLPWLLAVLVIAAEFLGAMGLVVGLLSRVAALGITAVMLGAIFTAHLQNGFFMNWNGNQAGEGYEYHLLVLAMAVAVMIRGAGRWSLDRMLSRKA